MCVCAILVCGVFVALGACGFVRELPIAGMPDSSILQNHSCPKQRFEVISLR